MSNGTDEDRRVFGGGDAPDAWAERGYDEDAGRVVTPDGEDAEKATTTQQNTDTRHRRDARDYIRPPYNPKQLALLSERNETHAAAIEAKSMGVAGYGFEIVPHPDYDEDERSDAGRKTAHEFWFNGDFQLGPDSQPTTAKKVHIHAREDCESVGWLALEVLSNSRTGKPTGLAHLPGHTIRKRDDAPGYVELDARGQPDGFYGAAGDRYKTDEEDDQIFVNGDTGETGSTLGSVGGVDGVANELIFIRNYSPLWPHYGTPDAIPALQTIEGDVAARQYNTQFFYNDGVPRFAVIVENGELTEQAWADLKETFQNLRGQENAHRGVILEGVTDVAQEYANEQNVSIRIEPLTVGVDEDSSFNEFRERNEHDILKAHSVPPVVVGRETQNYATAREQRNEFAQQTIQPRQEEYAEALYELIHVRMFDIPEWTIEFALHNAENRQRESEIAKTRIEASQGAITVNEARAQLGLEPFTDEDGSESATGRMLLAELVDGDIGGGGTGGVPEGPNSDDVDLAEANYDLLARTDGGQQ